MNNLKNSWIFWEDQNTYNLVVNSVQIASVQESDNGGWDIYAYDSDWQEVFHESLGNSIVNFDTSDIAKDRAETVFHCWLVKTCKDILYSE